MSEGLAKRSRSSDEEKTNSGLDAKDTHESTSPETSLHRGLQSRHITMIAIGGAIGTGLIIGTGKALAQAGPASVFISYTIIGFVVFLVMAALGEMAAWLPISAGFTGYASRFCDPSLGFALGWCYWFKYIIVTPNQLTAAALVIQYWLKPEDVNPGVFIAVFLVVICLINYFGIRFFGEFEFWLSSFKVVIIIGLILFTFILALGGGPDHDRKGFRYWKEPGAFKPYINEGASGKFLGFWSCMVTATFAYLGTELVGVTVAEAQNPARRVLFVGMNVPYDADELAMGHVINGCILVFVFSASNSDLYIASRTLYGMASDGQAPAIFKRTNKRGVPVYALGFSALFALLAFMNVSDDSTKVFGYFVNLVTIFGNPRLGPSYVAPLGIKGSYGALVMCIIVALTKNYDVFVGGDFGNEKYKTFITAYIGIPLYLISLFGHKFIKKTRGIKPHEVDFYTGKDIIDREEQEFLARKAAERELKGPNRGGWFYKVFLSWLF
ncbi:unnamed protein product [Parascedosporium putredinis]|uniref:Amino acid permease/ SLC12A domain-containing protein n=1 Tax=Parascedosporium putredinis TaxID=1442378 RepID=A0A9P1HEA3_9PEZI|nr:unnamed protein product [Parascedosporium putredinis]CAI8005025.1 unnamed protein product [Parascedosporium putredinis]